MKMKKIVSGFVLAVLLFGAWFPVISFRSQFEVWNSRSVEDVEDSPAPVVPASASAEVRFDPQIYTFITERGVDTGYRFNTTVELYDVTGLFTWQVRVYFNNTVLNATNAYYHPDEPIHKVNHMTVDPVIKNGYNATHGYVQFGISAIYPDYVNVTAYDYPLGAGICFIEFKVFVEPSSGKTLQSNLVLNNPSTYLIWKDGNTEISCTKRNGLYRLINPNIRVPTDYPTIQEAINAAESGDMIFVYNGTYYENVVVNKTLMLAGQSANTVVINGSGGTGGDGIYIDAVNDIIIDGFTITSGGDGVSIYRSSRHVLSSCTITNNSRHGVYAYPQGDDCNEITIQDSNIIKNGGKGVFAHMDYFCGYPRSCSSWIVRRTNVTENNDTGIFADGWEYQHISGWSLYSNNITANGGYGICKGPPQYGSQSGSGNWIIFSNNVLNNTSAGIFASVSVYSHMDSWIVRRNNVISNRGDGICVKEIGWGLSANGWDVSDNSLVSNSGDGLQVASSWEGETNYWTVESNNISKNEGAGIRVQAESSPSLKGWSILNNVVSQNLYGLTMMGTQHVLRGNLMTGNMYNFGILGNGVHDIDTSNTVNGKPIYYWINRQTGEVPANAGYIALVDSANIAVRNLSLSHNEQGITLVRTQNITLESFCPTDNIYGVYVQESSNYTLCGNKIFNHTYAVYIVQSENMNVTEVDLTNNTYGICLLSCSDITVLDSKVADNTYGIYIQDSSNITIYGSRVTNNTYGIFLSTSIKNTISTNNIKQNEYGIYISESSASHIFHNNFVQNDHHAIISGTAVNSWNSSYPSGGNYWSGYIWEDEQKGVYQNETGSDGIFDKAYVIDQSNIDNYPLCAPWSPPIRIILPGNTTYRELLHDQANINLTFTLDFTASWIGYSLDGGANVTITGNITLTDLSYGLHDIIVYANDTSGNMYSSAKVHFTITFLCDLNYDGTVDMKDVAMPCYAYGSIPEDPRWKCKVDVNRDGIIDIEDIAMVATDYGKTW
jgi:parallel beta-helix repeat protein